MRFSLWRTGRAELSGGGGRVLTRFMSGRPAAQVCRLDGEAARLDAFFAPRGELGAGQLVVYGGDVLFGDTRKPVVVRGLSPRAVPRVARHLASVDLTRHPEGPLREKAEQLRTLYACAAVRGEAVLKVTVY